MKSINLILQFVTELQVDDVVETFVKLFLELFVAVAG